MPASAPNSSRLLHRLLFLFFVALIGAGAAAAAALAPGPPMVAYVTADNHIAVVGANGLGGHVLPLGNGVSFDPSWSPDGTRLAYAAGPVGGGTGISVTNLDGSGVGAHVFVGPDLERPRWSPGGRWIAFEDFPVADSSGTSVDYLDLWVVRGDGTHPRLLLKSPQDGPGDGSLASQNGDAWSWSPNGRLIAIEWPAEPPDANMDTILNVEIVDVVTGESKLLARGGQPAWSPDGRRLAYVNSAGIAIIGIDGSGLRTLVHIPASDVAGDAVEPSWSPDGKTIAYWTPGDMPSLELVDVSGHAPPRLLLQPRDAIPEKPEWSRSSNSLLASTQYGDIWLVPVKAGSRPVHLAKGGDADWRG